MSDKGKLFISVYYRYGQMGYRHHDTLAEARKFLYWGSEDGEHMDVAIINTRLKKMIWYKDYLSEETCKEIVDKLFAKIDNELEALP